MNTYIYKLNENSFNPKKDLFFKNSNLHFLFNQGEKDLTKSILSNSTFDFYFEDEIEKIEIISLLNKINEAIYIDLGKYEDEDYLCKKEILSILNNKNNKNHKNKGPRKLSMAGKILVDNISSKFQSTQSTLNGKTETTIKNK